MHLERRQSVSEEPLKTCESCGGKLEKQWSLSGFQFKGEGWYVTDYSKSKDAGSKEAASSTVKEKTASAESTSEPAAASKETKSEKKAEPTIKKDSV